VSLVKALGGGWDASTDVSGAQSPGSTTDTKEAMAPAK